jgi:hypothetical protein
VSESAGVRIDAEDRDVSGAAVEAVEELAGRMENDSPGM